MPIDSALLQEYLNNQNNPQAQNSNQVEQNPMISPEIIKGALARIKDLSDYVDKANPHPENYHPSKLRSILGNVAGTLYGGVTANPKAGMNIANTIKNAPINSEMNRYKQGLEAPTIQANLGIQEAALGNQSAENLYKYIQGQNLISEMGKRKADLSKPETTVLPAIIPPGGTVPMIGQTSKKYNPETGEWEVKNETLGESPVSTPEERQDIHEKDRASREAINKNTQEQANLRAKERNQTQREIASIRRSGTKNLQRVQLMARMWGTLPPAYSKEIANSVYLKHPEFFTQIPKMVSGQAVTDAQGNPVMGIGLKTDLTPKQRADYQLAIADESQKILLNHNHQIGLAMQELEKNNVDNPLIVNEDDGEDNSEDNQ